MEPVLPDSMGNKCWGGVLLSFANTTKAQLQTALHLYLLFTPTHSLLTSASAQGKISILVIFFSQLESQLPARAQVWAVVGGGKEAGAGRFVLLSPQRFSEFLLHTFYLMSHLDASSKWSRSLQAMVPIWLARLKWREFRVNFASYFTGVSFSRLLRIVFFPHKNPE